MNEPRHKIPNQISMMKLILPILLLSASLCSAANRYVRAGATGAGTGTDWTDAYSALPATLVRGDTYYVAGGTYPGYSFTTAASGATLITVKKATTSDHGTETGWVSSYGTSQAVWTGYFHIYRSNLVLDGQVRNESDWFAGAAYGFKIQNTGGFDNLTHMKIANGETPCTNITVKYMFVAAIVGRLPPVGQSYRPYAIDTENYSTSLRNTGIVMHRVFVDGGNNPFFMRTTKDVIVEYCASDRTCGTPGPGFHGECINLFYVNGATARYNHLRNAYNGVSGYPAGGGSACIVVASSSSAYIYGNICESYLCGDGGIASGWPNSGIKVYNNTFINGVQGSGSLVRLTIYEGNTGNEAYNNLAVNCANSGYSGLGSFGNNASLPTSALVNHAGGNYRLAAATVAGRTLGSPYTTDRLGTTRGADGNWDLGAYEFSASGGVGDTNVPTVSITAPTNNAVISNSVSFTANASDDTGVSGVQFYVNNVEIADDTASAYATTWDTTIYANGVYSIRARARDAAGNFGYSGTNSVSISNVVAAPSAPIYWPLSEDTGTISTDEGAANVLTFNGNAAWDDGRIGAGISFDGTGDYLTAPNSSSLNIGDADFTAACWVKLTNQSTWQQILAKVKAEGSFTSPYFSWHLFAGHNSTTNFTPMFQVVNASSVSVNIASSVQVLYGDWVHLVGVYDGVNVKIYVNGTLRGTAAQTGNVLQYTQPFYVGAHGGPGEYMKGVIDEIRIYDDAFTAAQVLELYQTTPPETSPPQVVIEPVGFELIGQSASSNLTVSVTGTAPLYYQWRRYVTNNVGSNTNFFAVSGVANIGDYDVVITNSAGSITSATVAVTIVLPPTVTPITFTRTNLFVGSMLSVEPTTSNGVVNMVWYRGDELVFGTFNTTNRLDKVVGVLDSGIYTCVLTNQAGNAESSSFQVYVYQSSNTTTTVINAGAVRNP